MPEIPWDECPHRLRFEQQVVHMEEMTKQVISSVSAKIDNLGDQIRTELKHNYELIEQSIDGVKRDLTNVAGISRENRTRIAALEEAVGKRALAAWKWMAGVGATVGGGVLVGWILRAFLSG